MINGKKLVTHPDFLLVCEIVIENRKGGDLMSSDTRFGTKDLVFVKRTLEQPSQYA
tara:strand:+ start:1442 stop:1609 length:168 start_codon:yes stop_codon:yes gene_type:complete